MGHAVLNQDGLRNSSKVQTTYRLLKQLLRMPLLFASMCLAFVAAPAWPEELSSIEERLVHMEREMQLLKQTNQRLEQELEKLREQMQLQEETSDRTAAGEESDAIRSGRPHDSREETEAIDLSGSRLSMAYKNGFNLTSDDGQYKLRLGGRITGRFKALDSGHPLNDEFSVERARLYSNASLLDYYDLRIQVEFSEDPKLKDGYWDIHHIPWAILRLGQFKTPFTWEYLQSHKYIDFAERSMAVDNMRFKGRDIGVMLHGRFCEDMIQYQLAVLNGTGENRADDNDAKDVAGRLFLRPFRKEGNELFSDLHLGIAATWGDQDTDFEDTDFRTVAGTRFVDFVPDTVHKGDRTRLGTELMWPMGPASIKAEWMQMWLDNFQLGSLKEDLDFYSWYVSGSYLLSGEKKTLGKLVPNRPFNPSEGMWGAWELAARYSLFHSDSDLFKGGMAAGTDQAEAFTIGLNWYLNELLRITLNYEHSEFDDDLVIGGRRLDDEDAFIVQCQLEF